MQQSIPREVFQAVIEHAIDSALVLPGLATSLREVGRTAQSFLMGAYFDPYGNRCPAAQALGVARCGQPDDAEFAVRFDRRLRQLGYEADLILVVDSEGVRPLS